MKVVSVILAGGKGTRLLPVTLDIPKPLVEFQGKKLIDYSLEAAVCVSDEIIVTACYKADLVEKYIKQNWPNVICVRENYVLGTGGSLRCQLNFLRSMNPDVVLLLMTDHLRDVDMEKVIIHHIDSQYNLTVLVSNPSVEHDLLLVKDGVVVDFINKIKPPEINLYSSTGEYVFLGKFLCEELANKKADTFFNLGEDFVKPIIKSGLARVGVFYVERWDDIGTLDKIAY